jgi:hypothetical protein
MRCAKTPAYCHRMKTVSEEVTKKFENGDMQIIKRQYCAGCARSRAFTVVQQSLFAQEKQ